MTDLEKLEKARDLLKDAYSKIQNTDWSGSTVLGTVSGRIGDALSYLADEIKRLKPQPCPFCKGTHTAAVRNNSGYRIACQKCCARGPVRGTEVEALAAWNAR